MPDLLQTADYAQAIAENSVDGTRVAAIVSLRLERQTKLAQRDPRARQYYVVDEAVIRRHPHI